MTPIDIINLALKTSGALGVGQVALPEDTNDAFILLNMLLAEYNHRRWLVYHLVDIACTMTGSQTYTIGISSPASDFDVPRPDRIEAAYARYLPVSNGQAVDYPLDVIAAREDYSRIALKAMNGPMSAIFCDSAYPVATIYVFPVPLSGQQELHLLVKETLTAFPNLVTNISLPAIYFNALLYALATRLRPQYQLPPDPSLTALALQTLNVVRMSNSQVRRLQVPRELLSPAQRWFGDGFPWGIT